MPEHDPVADRQVDALEGLVGEGLCRDGTLAATEQQRLALWRIREGQSEATRPYRDIIRSDVAVPIRDIPAADSPAREPRPATCQMT